MIAETLAAVAAINLASFAAFGLDKRRARTGGRRIAESTLLLMALAGGTPGAFAGRRAFRHKTRKQPFVARLYAVAALQIAAAMAAAWWLTRQG
ncbi:DUF1294 domain-containing protein [Oricola thermophila]|nr:DUF1294 domain-containing protein [Oricola thermophila]